MGLCTTNFINTANVEQEVIQKPMKQNSTKTYFKKLQGQKLPNYFLFGIKNQSKSILALLNGYISSSLY